MKKHTVYGYELIKNTIGASHRIALVALQHHERESLIGQNVSLTDGRIGIVVLINLNNPSNPLIKINDEFVDLSKEPALHIEQVI